MVSEKGLEGNHYGISDIAITSVILNLLGEYVTGVDYSRYVLHVDIFGMMTFTNHVLPEVGMFDTF